MRTPFQALFVSAAFVAALPRFAFAQRNPLTPDSAESAAAAAFHAATARAAARGAHDAGKLWGARLDTVPILGVAGKRILLSADPRRDGYVPVAEGVWGGALPAGVIPSNTSLSWADRRWAMVLLPLPEDTVEATRLLLHETWHVAQPDLMPVPAYSESAAGSALLDQPEGRIWLQLEWRALADALESHGSKQSRDVERALAFRARRYNVATADERVRERALDINEGLAEYTAWKLGGGTPKELAAALRAKAPATQSFVRAFPYYTGPAYAMLLDARRPGWTAALRETPDLQGLVAATLPAARRSVVAGWLQDDGPRAGLGAAAIDAGTPLGLVALLQSEDTRWTERQRAIATLRARFVDAPTLRIRPGAVSIGFDPRGQTSLGDAGTVMTNLVWKTEGGAELTAPAGGLVTGDWKEIRVPVDTVAFAAGALGAPRRWHTKDWTLALPAGWVLTRDGASWVAVPPAPATP